MRAGVCMWRISFWLFFSIGYIIINNSIKADFNPYRPNLLHFHISIHAPRAGSDRENSDHYPDFQIILVWLFVFGRT